MGLAWCYEQDGQIDQAVSMYRQAHDMAWEQGVHGEFSEAVGIEAGQALLRLLPPDETRERERIQKRIHALEAAPRVVTPVLVPLTDATELRDLIRQGSKKVEVIFDLIGDGRPKRWEWITDRAGWLVWDPRGSGIIRDGRQLFGSTTWWIFWEHGYQPLSLLDDDGDGWLRQDELWGLAIWHDRNLDGRSQDGEVRPLAMWGIEALAVEPSGREAQVWFHPSGVILATSARRPTYDWIPQAVGAASHRRVQRPSLLHPRQTATPLRLWFSAD